MSAPEPIEVIVREPGRAPLRVVVTDDALEVGRDCRGLLLSDPRISRHHLSLRATVGGLLVIDERSTNGTRIAGTVIDRPQVLETGELVELGSTTIALVEGARPTGPSRPAMIAVHEGTSIDLVAAAAVSDPPDLATLSDDSGTLTIVFSDIERSTEWAVSVGDEAWVGLLDVHNAIVRRNVARHGGTEVKAQGDGFMLTFPSARRAVGAMIDVQRMLSVHARSRPTRALKVRVGIHTGEAIRDEGGDLFGRHVILASRVAGLARGGEILVSDLVRELLAPRAEFEFGEGRIVQLKGIDAPQRVHTLKWDPRR